MVHRYLEVLRGWAPAPSPQPYQECFGIAYRLLPYAADAARAL